MEHLTNYACSAHPKVQDGLVPNGESSHSKSKISKTDMVLNGLLDWLCSQVKASMYFMQFYNTVLLYYFFLEPPFAKPP